jgi:MFS family permease
MSAPHAGHRLGPVQLAPGVTRGHALSYLWAAFVSIGMFTYASALQPFILKVNIGVPADQVGVVSGDLQFWQEVLGLLVIGMIGAWSDRVGRRIVYIAGFSVTALAYAAYPFADDVGQLLIYRLIFAVGVAALGGMLATVLADYPVDADRGKLTGMAFFLNAVGAFLFLTVLVRLPQWFIEAGFSEVNAGRAAYLSAGAAVCVVSALVMFGLKPGRPDQVREREPLLTLLGKGLAAGRRPRIALAYACSFAARADLVIVALFLTLWVSVAAVADGYTPAQALQKQGILFAVVQASAMIWAPFFGWLADKIDRVTMVILATVLSIGGYGWMGLTPDPTTTAALGAGALLGIGQASGILASQVLIAQEAPGPIRGAVIGMVGFFGALGILAISKIGGIAFDDWRPGAPFIIMAAANVLLLVFAFWVRAVSEPYVGDEAAAQAQRAA